jgi:hypothetical protein
MARAKNTQTDQTEARQASAEEAPRRTGSHGEGKRPVFEARLGRVRAAVWANPAPDGGVRFSTSLSRSFKDPQTGEWRSAGGFWRDDLPLVALVCEEAFVWLLRHGNGQGGNSAQGAGERGVSQEEPIRDEDIPF